MSEHAPTGTVLFGVLDGHGEAGDLVSRYVADRLPQRLVRNPHFGSSPANAIKEELDRLERAMLGDASIDTEFSGSTAVLATVRERKLTVCNVGDSRIITARLVDGKLVANDISIDHKPDREDEQRRIVATGGRVFAVEYDDGISGPPRVWLGHMDIPGLAMSRSIGDTVAHSAGVSSEPEVFHYEFHPDDKLIILASDGLWEFMSSQEVVDFIARVPDPKRAVDMLVAESAARWMKEEQVIDDTTIIVAYL
jgi:serine/threonine protein phosphatase PrpC